MGRFAVIPGGRAADAAPAPERGDGLLADLYRRHAAGVLARCRYLLRDEEAARDATQEVFARALRALAEFRGAASPTTWLLRIATHHCLNELRAARAGWREELRRLAEARSEEGPEPDRRELLRALLGAAGPEEQEMAVLYYVDELTQAEIAAATGRSLPTVRKRLRAFLAAARAALAQAHPGLALPEGGEP
ncbi:MAG TPA: sigma-70 family RNA polymerase sigma factor [Anaeromyxobacteraceae bacterium]